MSQRQKPKTSKLKPTGGTDRKRRFRETARDILHMATVKRRYGQAVDAAGSVAQAMERAYRQGFQDALRGPAEETSKPETETSELKLLPWTLIPARTRRAFWSICLAALGREGRTESNSYLVAVTERYGRLAWKLVVPDVRPYDKSVGDGTIKTLLRLNLLEIGGDESRVVLTEYGIRTWNGFCELGGHWPDDLVEKFS